MDLKPKPLAKRGRPSSASIPQKIIEGKNSDSAIKCSICFREFPRTKSLQAHLRTHTGQKPYICDYPGCTEAFKQSGHLRSHIYTHTGEKPYRCPVEGCKVRYPHSNRRCPRHKLFKLIRDGKEVICTDLENLSAVQICWLQLYKTKKFVKVSKVSHPKMSSTKLHNLKRKMTVESVHFGEESFDKEPFPRKSSSPVPTKNYETSGYGSCTSNEPSSSPEHYQEEMNICNSSKKYTFQLPKNVRLVDYQAALTLIDLSQSDENGPSLRNEHMQVDQSTEFLNSLKKKS